MESTTVTSFHDIEGFQAIGKGIEGDALEFLHQVRHIPDGEDTAMAKIIEYNLVVIFQIHVRFQAFYEGYKNSQYWIDVAEAFGARNNQEATIKFITRSIIRYRAEHHRLVKSGNLKKIAIKPMLARLVDDQMRFLADPNHTPQFRGQPSTYLTQRIRAVDDMRQLMRPDKKPSLFLVDLPDPRNRVTSQATMPVGTGAELGGFTFSTMSHYI